jgi:hypothetical protein
VAGSGDIRADGLAADAVEVRIAGSGDVKVQADKTLQVNIAGSGDVVYGATRPCGSRSWGVVRSPGADGRSACSQSPQEQQPAGGSMGDPGQHSGGAAGPAHVAIVGCGFTGTSALLQLVDGCPVQRITVFEASGDFGPGFAWKADDCADYLINNTTDSMCLLPGNRQAFIQWLRGRGDTPDPKGHLPRRVYGDFLAEAVRAARVLAAAKGIGCASCRPRSRR